MKKLLSLLSALILTLIFTCSFSSFAAETAVEPKSNLEYPRTNSGYLVKGVYVSGWALNASGIKEIDVYIDNTFVCKTTCNLPRADVDRIINVGNVYTNGDKAGYSVMIPDDKFDLFKSGEHTLRVDAVGNDGSKTTDMQKVTKVAPKASLEEPRVCLTYTNNGISVSGWSTSASGVENVKVYINNTYICDATLGRVRNDVEKIINSENCYNNALHSGFAVEIPHNKIINSNSDSYTVKIISTGFDGETITKEETITKATAQSSLESPTDSYGILNNGIYVSGWALNASGINKINIYIDGNLVGTTTASYLRTDVNKIINYNNNYYNGLKSGYKITIPYSKLSSFKYGNHTAKIIAVGNDGKTTTNTKTFNKIAPKVNLEAPVSDNNNMVNNIHASGWSIAESGIQKVQIYVDNTYIADANLGSLRNDVNNALNSSGNYYDAVHSGFHYDLPADKLKKFKSGQHTIKAVCYANDGETITDTAVLNKLQLMPHIDDDNINTNCDFNIKGWALSSSEIAAVKVSYGSHAVEAQLSQFNLSSSDVKSAFDPSNKNYVNCANCRFLIPIDIDTLSYDSNKIIITITEASGTVTSFTTTVNRKNSGVKYGRIDAPLNGTVFATSMTKTHLSGWALVNSGYKNLKVFLDGKELTEEIHKNISSPDLVSLASAAGVSTQVANNSRFYSDDIDLSKLAIGNHKIEVYIYANDGSVYCMPTEFKTVKESYQKYNITLQELSKDVNMTGQYFQFISPELIMQNPYGIYEFMNLNWVDGITEQDINKMLENCGVLENKGKTFIDAGKLYNINPVYLAAHARIESGNGTSTLSKGITIANSKNYTFSGKTYAVKAGKYYNQFGINAVDNNPIIIGSNYAACMNWNSVESSIMGGAKWIHDKYIWGGKPNQTTLYTMRFDPAFFDDTYNTKYCYATDTQWATSIAKVIYENRDILVDKNITFEYPQFN